MEKKFVVCINGDFSEQLPGCSPIDPIEGEIYQVDGISEYLGRAYYDLVGMPDQYVSINFRPVDYSVGERVCESIERQPVKQLA